jgi:hypothetical protein
VNVLVKILSLKLPPEQYSIIKNKTSFIKNDGSRLQILVFKLGNNFYSNYICLLWLVEFNNCLIATRRLDTFSLAKKNFAKPTP